LKKLKKPQASMSATGSWKSWIPRDAARFYPHNVNNPIAGVLVKISRE
jgi:hypothetical protein